MSKYNYNHLYFFFIFKINHKKYFWKVCATVISTLLIDKLGRRILIMTSAILMIISLYGLGLYFWILDHNPQLAFGISILPLISLCMFIFGFSIGFGPIPLLLMSEMFSPEAKGIASSITSKNIFCNFSYAGRIKYLYINTLKPQYREQVWQTLFVHYIE